MTLAHLPILLCCEQKGKLSRLFLSPTNPLQRDSFQCTRNYYNPTEWQFIQTHSAGDLLFPNKVDQMTTWYTPEGMASSEIMEIRGAMKLFQG